MTVAFKKIYSFTRVTHPKSNVTTPVSVCILDSHHIIVRFN